MKRLHLAIAALLGALAICPSAALAGGSGKSGKDGDEPRICVRADNGGRGSTDIDVKRFEVGPNDLPAARVTATPDEGGSLGPLTLRVNAQVAVLQVVLNTNEPAILNGANVAVIQGNSTAGGGAAPGGGGDQPPQAGTPPPGDGGATTPTAPGITIAVNAQVAVVQVVVGTGNIALLDNINVAIIQGNQLPAPPT